VNVSVCHYNPGNGGVIVVVAVQSVDDANGLNGHGTHGNDSWASFEFGGVTYPGQGDVGNCQSEEEPEEDDLCSIMRGYVSPKKRPLISAQTWKVTRVLYQQACSSIMMDSA